MLKDKSLYADKHISCFAITKFYFNILKSEDIVTVNYLHDDGMLYLLHTKCNARCVYDSMSIKIATCLKFIPYVDIYRMNSRAGDAGKNINSPPFNIFFFLFYKSNVLVTLILVRNTMLFDAKLIHTN